MVSDYLPLARQTSSRANARHLRGELRAVGEILHASFGESIYPLTGEFARAIYNSLLRDSTESIFRWADISKRCTMHLAAKVLSEVVKAPRDRLKLRLWRRARMIRLLQAASNPTLLKEHSNRVQNSNRSMLLGCLSTRLLRKYTDFEAPKENRSCRRTRSKDHQQGREGPCLDIVHPQH